MTATSPRRNAAELRRRLRAEGGSFTALNESDVELIAELHRRGVLTPDTPRDEPTTPIRKEITMTQPTDTDLAAELAALRAELAALRRSQTALPSPELSDGELAAERLMQKARDEVARGGQPERSEAQLAFRALVAAALQGDTPRPGRTGSVNPVKRHQAPEEDQS